MAGMGATWHIRSAIWHFYSAVWHLSTPRRLCHGGLTPYAFPMLVLRFRVFWKKISFFYDHETLSYYATNSLKPISNMIRNWCRLYKWFRLWQIFASRLAKHNNHKQKSSMASNHNFSHSTIHDINRLVHSFDFSTKTNFTA